MRKLFLTGLLLCSAIILVGAQTGFAWSTYEEGCQNCHGTGFSGLTPPLHTLHAAQACTICHPGAAGAKPIPTSTCAGCHPAADPGVCPLISAPAHAATQATCLACHTDCAPVTTTTTVAESTTTTTTTEEPTTTTTTTPPAGEIEVSIDIKPGSCPNPIGFARNRGVVPFAIMGTTDFDITQIDPESIRITREGVDAEVAPIRWTYEDVATPFEGELCDCDSQEYDGEYDSGEHDGQMDLLMKVYKYDLVNNLKLQEVAGDTIPLTVTGKLKDEFGSTSIKGQDCVRVLKAVLKGNKGHKDNKDNKDNKGNKDKMK